MMCIKDVIKSFLLTVGESGLVYRGYINGDQLVAVKTGKGIIEKSRMHCSYSTTL